MTPVLSITGSDSTGGAGVQADIQTISAMGGYALSVISSVVVQNTKDINCVHNLPTNVVIGQIKAIFDDMHPKAIKLGMLNDPNTIKEVRNEIVGCKNIVCDPGVMTSNGNVLMNVVSIKAFCTCLLPVTTIVLLRCCEAEKLLGITIVNNDDMLYAAKELTCKGVKYVMLRGGLQHEGRITALLYGENKFEFFSSYNIDGWQKHGVRGALSTAIATRLAFGDDVFTAVRNAHDFIRCQVVYAVPRDTRKMRPSEIYNTLLSLIAANYTEAHDVAFYAEKLSITSRYLSQVTKEMVGKSPKQIINDYLLQEIERLLSTTSMNIQEISIKLGFSSQIMLSKFYHSKRGISPSEYRH